MYYKDNLKKIFFCKFKELFSIRLMRNYIVIKSILSYSFSKKEKNTKKASVFAVNRFCHRHLYINLKN